MFDDISPKLPIMNRYFCRGRRNNCNMFYLKQNIFSTNRQKVRENCNLFILFKQRGKVLETIYHDIINEGELSYRDFIRIGKDVRKKTTYFFCY